VFPDTSNAFTLFRESVVDKKRTSHPVSTITVMTTTAAVHFVILPDWYKCEANLDDTFVNWLA